MYKYTDDWSDYVESGEYSNNSSDEDFKLLLMRSVTYQHWDTVPKKRLHSEK